MLKKPIIGMLLACMAGCLPQLQPDQIIVDGEASLDFEPELFSLSAALRSRGDSQEKVLADIAKQLAEIRETLPNLEGLTHLTINASSAEITPIQDADCLENAGYRLEEQCPVIGYFGSISLGVKGSPAKASGYALSLLTELGAERVTLSGYSLMNREQAQQEAIDAAVKDARRKAENIAAAAKSNVIGPLRIQYGEGFSDSGYPAMMDVASPETIVVTASMRVTPETELDLDPQPIKIDAKVVAAFEIE